MHRGCSNLRPEHIEVERIGAKAVVYIRRNVEVEIVPGEEGGYPQYVYDEVRVESPWFDDIDANVAEYEDNWWEAGADEPVPSMPVDKRVDAVRADTDECILAIAEIIGG